MGEFEDYNDNKIIFLTYGNDKFKESRERIIKEAKDLHIFDSHIIETDETIKFDEEFTQSLQNDKFRNVYESERGGGYWIWKPYIVYKHLKNMNDGDILVYADAGCSIKNNNETINGFETIIKKLRNNDTNMILNDLGERYLEKHWNKGNVLHSYGVYNNEEILNESQYEGGRIFMIKNNKTMEIITKWWDTAKKHPEFFDDSESEIPNKDGFKEHRHDQSNISILCKLHEECSGDSLHGIIQGTRLRK